MSALVVRDLAVARAGRDVLRGISFRANPREIVALMGASGSGKTTTLRAIAGLDGFDAGEIAVGDTRLPAGTDPRLARRALHQAVGMVMQFHGLFEHLTAIENVMLAPMHVQRRPRRDAEVQARALLQQLGVGHRAQARPRELSGGEAQRVAIARALAVDPPVLLLDEPTASLDPARSAELARLLRSLAGEGRTLVISSHDETFVAEAATRVVVLSDGVVVEAGAPADVLRRPAHPETQRLLAARAHATR